MGVSERGRSGDDEGELDMDGWEGGTTKRERGAVCRKREEYGREEKGYMDGVGRGMTGKGRRGEGRDERL